MTIKNSKIFAGVADGDYVISNMSGKSEGVRGDGNKSGGQRLNLDVLCGDDYYRCARKKLPDGSYQIVLNDKGMVEWDASKAGGSLSEFLKNKEEKDLYGATGGLQGMKGTFFGIPYEPGDFFDKLVEAFAGTHDVIVGQMVGLYDDQGNIRQGMSDAASFGYDVWSVMAIIPSAPFAMAELLPPDLWNVLSRIVKGAQ